MAKKLLKIDLQNLPGCAAEFIKLVIKKMRYRRKVRQDVMAELAAHFEDGLQSCKTDEEREQKAQQLIAEFGDVKLLAVLLRRAKRRCRPLWRTMVARGFQTIGILILCLIVYTAWFVSGKPSVTVDYVAELNRIVRPVADDSLNAAPFYEKAAKVYEKVPDNISELLGKTCHEVGEEEKEIIEKWLTDNKKTLDLVIAGTKRPYYWLKYKTGEHGPGEMISVIMPNLSEFRRLTFSLCWRAQLNAERGDYEKGFDDLKSCYLLGRHLKGDMTLIEQLVGIAIRARVVASVRDILSQHEIDSAELVKLQSDFEELVSSEDFAVSFRTERLFIYDEIQRCFTEGRFGRGHLYLPRIMELGETLPVLGTGDRKDKSLLVWFYAALTHPGVLFTHPNKEETRKEVDLYYDFWEQMSKKNPAQVRAENIDFEKQETDLSAKSMFLKMLTPAFKKIHLISYRLPADVGSTLTIIALLRYKQDIGSYPENLNEMVTAGYLKELPIDPWSDRPLVYKKTDDDFILYSVGLNFIDDGGESGKDKKGKVKLWADEGDAVFWPVQRN